MAVLDTTVLIDLTRRRPQARVRAAAELVRQLRSAGQVIATTRFNVAELYVGIALSANSAVEETRLQGLLGGLIILEFEDDAARLFGTIMARLRRAGRPVGDMDALIASVAIANGHALVTRNARHFVPIAGLVVHEYS